MTLQTTVDVRAGIMDRGLRLFALVEKLQTVPSDAEVEGLLRLLPGDARENLGALLAPELREVGLCFMEMIRQWMYDARDAKASGKKVVLVPFNFPPEVVRLFDNAVPLTTEVLTTVAAVALPGGGDRYWSYIQSLGLPDHVCSANSVEIASLLSGKDFLPDAIISAAPGSCDANSKVHELLSHLQGIPQFIFEKPVDDGPEGRVLYGKYFRTLIGQLEDLTGETLDGGRLRSVVEKANRCAELYWELWEYRKMRPCPLPNLYNLFLAAARFCMWGTDSGVRMLEAMLEGAEQRRSAGLYTAGEERCRVLWSYTSYYFNLAQLQQWMGKRGWSFLADILSLYLPQPIDLTSRETMIQGLADTAWDYPMNRQMGSSSMSRAWVADVVWAARELGADCAVHCGHDACKQSWSVVSILGDELMKQAGVPLLTLHGDSWMKTVTPITVIQKEMQEFIGNLVLSRKRTRRRVRRRRPAAVSSALASEEP